MAEALEFNASLRSLQVNYIDAMHPMGLSSPCDDAAAGYLLRNRLNARQMGIIAPVARDNSDLGFSCLQHTCLRRQIFEFLLPPELVDEFFAKKSYIAKRPSSKMLPKEEKAPRPRCLDAPRSLYLEAPVAYCSVQSDCTMDSLPAVNKMLQTQQGCYSVDSLPSCAASSQAESRQAGGGKSTTLDDLPSVQGMLRGMRSYHRPSQARTMDALPSMVQDEDEEDEESEDEGMPICWTKSMPHLAKEDEDQFNSIRAVAAWKSKSLG